jgi:preprotein translocase subunit SecG
VLSRATTILAAVFMVTCLALSMLRPHSSSVLDKAGQAAPPISVPAAPAGSQPAASVPAASAPAAPAVPAPAASPSAR